MLRHRRILAASLLFASPAFGQQQPAKATVAQFLSPSSPLTLTAAKKSDRIAWMAYERGMRNVYTAAAPTFKPVKLTSWNKDDGVDLTNVAVSDDGNTIVFIRGHAPNRVGWIANPNHDPEGGQRAIWAVRANAQGVFSAPWKVADGAAPILSPDGRRVLYTKEGQIYSARIANPVPSDSVQRGEKPFIKTWGRNSNPRWSPDGSKVAFVSDRDNHSFIAVYDVAKRTVNYVAPGVDCDGSPTWSPDSKRIAFLRKPGVPFGRQGQQGSGSIGNPPGPAVARGGGAVGNCNFGGGVGVGAAVVGGAASSRTPRAVAARSATATSAGGVGVGAAVVGGAASSRTPRASFARRDSSTTRSPADRDSRSWSLTSAPARISPTDATRRKSGTRSRTTACSRASRTSRGRATISRSRCRPRPTSGIASTRSASRIRSSNPCC